MKNNQIKIISLIVFFSLFLSLLLITSITYAGDPTLITDMKAKLDGGNLDLPGGGNNPEETAIRAVGMIIGAFTSIFGIMFLALMIYGGYKWMMASGRDEEITKAKATIRGAIIGLIIVVSAYAITYFISLALQSATSAT